MSSSHTTYLPPLDTRFSHRILIRLVDLDIASTSPPNSRGFVSSSASSTASFPDYEVEVVEIRVDEGYLSKIMP